MCHLKLHERFFAFVDCIKDTMHLLGITFILCLLKQEMDSGKITIKCAEYELEVEVGEVV